MPSTPDADDAAAFEAFARANGDRLLHVAWGLCGDWQHAEDLVQQALIALASRWGRVDNPSAYAYRCLARANIDRWRSVYGRRRTRRELLAGPDTLEELGPSAPADDGAGVLDVLGALRELPSRQRAIVVLRYLDDLSEAQVADALGISVGSVKSGASRALARLRESAGIRERLQ